MQRTVFDRTYTPGGATKIVPHLERLYPPKEFDYVTLPTRVEGRRRVRIVIQRRKPRSRRR